MYLLQGEDLLPLSLVQILALVLQSSPLLLQTQHLVLQTGLFRLQVADGRLVGHLCGLQAADLT